MVFWVARLVIVLQLVEQLVCVLDLVMSHVPFAVQVFVGPHETAESHHTEHGAHHQTAVSGPPGEPVVAIELPDQVSDERILQAFSGQSLLIGIQFWRHLLAHFVDAIVRDFDVIQIRVAADTVTHLAQFT